MKSLKVLLVFLILSVSVHAQKYIAKNGHIWFFSHTPVEDIEAHNNQVVSILNATDGSIQFSLLVKSFQFKKALMQEHFNENYMESDKIPKAGFTGMITNQADIHYDKDGTYPAQVTGELTIHGVTRPVSTIGALTVTGKSIHARAKFIVMPKDFDITIPAVVEQNIAKDIEVNVDVTYNQ